jgi:hypothetical protein
MFIELILLKILLRRILIHLFISNLNLSLSLSVYSGSIVLIS